MVIKEKQMHSCSGLLTVVSLIAILLLAFSSCRPGGAGQDEELQKVKIVNNSGVDRNENLISLQDSALLQRVSSFDNLMITAEGNDAPLQYQKVLSSDHTTLQEILVRCNLTAGETLFLELKDKIPYEDPGFVKLTQAEISVKTDGEWKFVTKDNGKEQYEYHGGVFRNIDFLRVPEQHTDHSFYIRYEGPGWESDKVGYRFYLDWRNATDIFGKRTTEPVLQDVGQDGFDSYHEDAPWGMDILKVGSSLGIGSPGFWKGNQAQRIDQTDSVSCKIIENGDLRSAIKTKYYGWKAGNRKVDLKSKLSIEAGSHLTRNKLYLSEQLENLCTGIVKHDSAVVLRSEENTTWQYLATWGRQSLNDDMLGMVVFFQTDDLIQITADKHSHVIVLKPDNNNLAYYFGAVWEKDPSGIHSQEEFLEYLNNTLIKLNTPVQISYENEEF